MIIKDYYDNKILRDSFNALAEKTFGLNFEDWYQNGYWSENYRPYSIAVNDKIIANVSVNKTDFLHNGKILHLIQLGTVMTDEEYRNQGLIRQIMDEIKTEFINKCDGIYLFAGEDVRNFYPKFGFSEATEYSYSKEVEISADCCMVNVPMNNKSQWKKLTDAIASNKFKGRFDMVNNSQLIMFYVTKFMQDCVYFCEKLNAYVIAEIENDKLTIKNIFSDKEIKLEDVINAFGSNIKKVTLEFTPQDTEGYTANKIKDDDCTLFIMGDGFEEYKKDKLMFPALSHA